MTHMIFAQLLLFTQVGCQNTFSLVSQARIPRHLEGQRHDNSLVNYTLTHRVSTALDDGKKL